MVDVGQLASNGFALQGGRVGVVQGLLGRFRQPWMTGKPELSIHPSDW
jgi:hypothetical protein